MTALKQTHRKIAMPIIVTVTMTMTMIMTVIVEAMKIYLILRIKILNLLMIWKNL